MQISNILQDGKALILNYDHGLEHGTEDFNLRSVDPENALDLALEGDYQGIILHHGVAKKYYEGTFKDVPLILKLNGSTNMSQIDPVSRQICSVETASKLEASAVGYTIYDGSAAEPEMFQEFGRIVEEAHDYGLPVIAWMYPKGPDIRHESRTENIAYAARVALELGADFVKVKYNNDPQGFPWIVKCAGRCQTLVSLGHDIDDRMVLESVKATMDAGATGAVVGRNAWHHPKPFSMTQALQDIIFEDKSVEEALQRLH